MFSWDYSQKHCNPNKAITYITTVVGLKIYRQPKMNETRLLSMKTILSALGILLFSAALAQKNESISESEWLFPYERTYFCLDEIKSVETQSDSLKSFEFHLFNRYGILIAQATTSRFNISDCIKVPISQIVEGTYTYNIRLTTPEGEEKQYYGHWDFLPENCE